MFQIPEMFLKGGYCYTTLVMPKHGRGWEPCSSAEVLRFAHNQITAAGSRPAQAASSALDQRCLSGPSPLPASSHADLLGLGLSKTRNHSTWIEPETGRKTGNEFLAKLFLSLPHTLSR